LVVRQGSVRPQPRPSQRPKRHFVLGLQCIPRAYSRSPIDYSGSPNYCPRILTNSAALSVPFPACGGSLHFPLGKPPASLNVCPQAHLVLVWKCFDYSAAKPILSTPAATARCVCPSLRCDESWPSWHPPTPLSQCVNAVSITHACTTLFDGTQQGAAPPCLLECRILRLVKKE